MDKTRYELYTKGSYDLFLSNLKYLLETVGADKIRVRVPKIPKLNTYADVRLNYELLKNMGHIHLSAHALHNRRSLPTTETVRLFHAAS